LMAE
jgi:ribosomal protein S15